MALPFQKLQFNRFECRKYEAAEMPQQHFSACQCWLACVKCVSTEYNSHVQSNKKIKMLRETKEKTQTENEMAKPNKFETKIETKARQNVKINNKITK